jgi:putative transcriptional regulator
MNSSLKADFARLGPIRAVDRVSAGSPAVFVLRHAASRRPKTVDAALALARRGMTLLRAKRAMEELLDTGRSSVDLPTVEDAAVLAADLAQAGIAAAQVQPPRSIDVRACATGSASAADNSPPGSAWKWRRCGTGRSAAASATPRRVVIST